MMQDKPWGTTEGIARTSLYHMDRIVVQSGGYCSIHKHAQKANVFHVLKGRLYVKQFTEQGGSLAARHIQPGETFTVPAGIWHQFHAQNGGAEALEVYMPGAEGVLIADDIERHAKLQIGGVASYGELAAMWRKAFNLEEQYVGR